MNERAPFVHTQENDPSLGAYPLDYAEGIVPLDDEGNPLDPTGTLATRGDGDPGFHSDSEGQNSVYDQANRHIPDEATGEAPRSDGEFDGIEDIHVVSESELDLSRKSLNEVMGMKSDLTSRWIAAVESGDTASAAAIESLMLQR